MAGEGKTTLLKAPSSLKADVWLYFGFKPSESNIEELDKTKAVCKLCDIEVKYCGNTTNLRNHLTRHHPTTQPNASDQKQTKLENAFVCKLSSSSSRAQKITEAIAVFICKDLRPFSVVENDGFQSLVKLLEPRYVLPTRKHLSEVAISKLYEEVKNGVATSLKLATRVALTCDSWTSRATDSYLTITCHYIDMEWLLLSHVLQTRKIQTSHTAKNLSDLLSDALQEWELTDKDPVIVTDNAANIVRAVELTSLLHVGCFAHTLNLASQAALKIPAVARLLGRVRYIVSFFHRSAMANLKLKEKQRMLNLPAHKLVIDVVTRWNSAMDMLERFLEQQPAISAALLSPEVRRKESDLCTLTEADITTAEDVMKALQPLKAATLVMSEEKTPTLSVVAPLHAQLLLEMSGATHDTAVIKDLKAAVYNNLNSRYLTLKDKLYVASALDPRFKTLPFLSSEARDNTFSRLVTEAAGPEQVDTSNQAGGGAKEKCIPPGPVKDATPPSPKRLRESALVTLLGSAYASKPATSQKTPAEEAQEEVNRYREVKPILLSDNPLTWWKAHAGEYPLLACLARRYLCVPGTSVSSERVFSTAGDIVTAQRSCLTPQHVDQLLFLQKNLAVVNK
ncbi:E3 SUMO-protein ligase ZBED1-like [Melanotaenia boesemani]|uniref:E3 SUMO-protein ligase ZBED1-like n=2 Tax=Melanotaenia boesemani TaxID=1250792 RepID=UPI001C04A074|nr:E3 SUMO-protein ligase ZBED1-like [Melanotaenia boesemani]